MLKGLKIVNIDETNAEIYLYGPIIDDCDKIPACFCDDDEEANNGYNFPLDIQKQLDELDGKTIDVYINSPGGSFGAGMAIANMLARHNGKTIAHNDGEVASIAVMPYLSCDEREMFSNAIMMVHQPSTFVAGNVNDLNKAIRALTAAEDAVVNMLSESAKKGVSVDDIRADVQAETWYTADKASAKYDITVVPARNAMVAYAGDPLKMFKNMPDFVKNSPKLDENSWKIRNISDDSDTKKQRKIAILNALNGI